MADMQAGKAGEDFAAEYFEKLGYKIAARNFHSRFGEIDVVAESTEFLVFAEVKTRKSDRYARACEAVDLKKQRKIALTAMQYISARNGKECPFRRF